MAINPSSRTNAKPADSEFHFGRYTNGGERGYPTGTAIMQEEVMDTTIPWQLILEARGGVPSNVQETSSVSQYYTALLQTFTGLEMQVGMFFAFPYSDDRPLLPPGYEFLSLHTAENVGSDIPFSPTDHPILAMRFPAGVLPNMEGRTLTGHGDFGYATKAAGEKGNGAVLNVSAEVKLYAGPIYATPTGAFSRGAHNPNIIGDQKTSQYSDNSDNLLFDASNNKYAGQSGTGEDGTPYQNAANGVYSKHLTVEWMCLADSPTTTLTVPSTFSVSSAAPTSIVAPKRYSSVVFKDHTAIFSKLMEKVVPITARNGAPLLGQNGKPTTKKITKKIPAWKVTF